MKSRGQDAKGGVAGRAYIHTYVCVWIDGWLVGWVRSVGRHPRGAICAFFAVIQQHAPPQKWAW